MVRQRRFVMHDKHADPKGLRRGCYESNGGCPPAPGAHAGNRKREAEVGIAAKPKGFHPHPAADRCWGKALAEGKWPAMPTHENARQIG